MVMHMTHQFGTRLRELRVERGLLQRDVEEALNLRPGTVSQYERGLREPGFDLLLTIAEFFDASVDYLLGRPWAPKDSPALCEARRQLQTAMQQVAAAMDGIPAGARLARLLQVAEATAPGVFDAERLARRLKVPAKALRKGQVVLETSALDLIARHLGFPPEWFTAVQ